MTMLNISDEYACAQLMQGDEIETRNLNMKFKPLI